MSRINSSDQRSPNRSSETFTGHNDRIPFRNAKFDFRTTPANLTNLTCVLQVIFDASASWANWAHGCQRIRSEQKYQDGVFSGIHSKVLEAFATSSLSFERSVNISASTKARFFPDRNTSARHSSTGPVAGRRNETLFSTVIGSRPSGAVVAAAPPQVWSAKVIRTPAWTNPCCCSCAGTTPIRVSHHPSPNEINSIPTERTNRARSKTFLTRFPFALFMSALLSC